MGFLDVIISIPENKEIITIIYKNTGLKPLDMLEIWKILNI